MESGSGHYGCTHYRRRCKIRAPCCNEIFDCRHCHNEAKNSLDVDPLDRHDVPRHEIRKVICSLCGTEQDVQQNCINCGVCMGKYFCAKCNFFDDNLSKNQYHCDGCGICRTGGKENFFHCDRCGCCYVKPLEDSHRCVERAMHHNCPVCFEYLFDSTKDISVLQCGHTIHLDCLKEMELRFQQLDLQCLYHIAGLRAPFAQDQSVICPEFGKNLIRRLRPLPCLKCTRTRWSGSSATTAAQHLMSIFILLHTGAQAASHTIQGRHGGPWFMVFKALIILEKGA